MTDEQINITIAEACGYRRLVHTNYGWMACTPDADLGPMSDDYLLKVMVPNYCNDLNAMHEAEKALTRYQQSVTYSDNLMKIVGYHTFDSAHATSRQRAEAFLRTIGKWEEVQP